MFKHFQVIPFIVGVVIGIIGVIYIKPEQTVVRKYPNPTGKTKTIYKDKNGVCYKYKATQVDCNKNEKNLKPYPLQG